MTPEMNENPNDQRLEKSLRRHFAAALDGQAGRARAAFERHMAQQLGAPGGHWSRPRGGARAATWLVGGVGAAIAASLAALWAVPLVWKATPTPTASTDAHIVRPPEPDGVQPVPPSATRRPATTETTTTAGTVLDAGGPRWTQVGLAVTSGAIDQGVVVIDDRTPARMVKRLSIERTQWVDPARGVRVETVVPRERTLLIGVDTY